MEILKEEKLEENECPKCNRPLDFSHNERRKYNNWFKQFLADTFLFQAFTGHTWFECQHCNKIYLIKDYAFEVINDE